MEQRKSYEISDERAKEIMINAIKLDQTPICLLRLFPVTHIKLVIKKAMTLEDTKKDECIQKEYERIELWDRWTDLCYTKAKEIDTLLRENWLITLSKIAENNWTKVFAFLDL